MKGSCLCGKVIYEIQLPFRVFQYCHCSRCQKITGSAHASNLFIDPKQFSWISGEESVGRYEPSEAKYFATGFCKECGSNLPWLVQGGKNMVVPAGSLDGDPGARPIQNIYWESKACWYEDPDELTKYGELPEKRR